LGCILGLHTAIGAAARAQGSWGCIRTGYLSDYSTEFFISWQKNMPDVPNKKIALKKIAFKQPVEIMEIRAATCNDGGCFLNITLSCAGWLQTPCRLTNRLCNSASSFNLNITICRLNLTPVLTPRSIVFIFGPNPALSALASVGYANVVWCESKWRLLEQRFGYKTNCLSLDQSVPRTRNRNHALQLRWPASKPVA
jgi:hypothetical protein